MYTEPTADPPTASALASIGHALAARALLAGGACTQQRVADLLKRGRRSIGRLVDADLTAAVQNADAVAQARACLTASAGYGSTSEERDAADAWLVQAGRDDQRLEQTPSRPRSSAGRGAHRRAKTHAHRGSNGRGPTPVKRLAPKPAAPPVSGPPHAGLLLEALTRQQQRILHRSTLVHYVVTGGQALAMGEALTELLADKVGDGGRFVASNLGVRAFMYTSILNIRVPVALMSAAGRSPHVWPLNPAGGPGSAAELTTGTARMLIRWQAKQNFQNRG